MVVATYNEKGKAIAQRMTFNTNTISDVTYSVILACPESLFTIPNPEASGEGFPTSGNDNKKDYVNLFNAFVLVNIGSGMDRNTS